MYKIGVLSDTHIPMKKKYIPGKIFDIFKDVDLIMHAGDICQLKVIQELEQLVPVIAVAGNMDAGEILLQYKKNLIKEIEGKRFLLIHGHQGEGTALDYAQKRSEGFDCVVFGHSHQPYNQKYNVTYLFNPGSPVDYQRPNIPKKEPSVGLLKIRDSEIEGEIVYWD